MSLFSVFCHFTQKSDSGKAHFWGFLAKTYFYTKSAIVCSTLFILCYNITFIVKVQINRPKTALTWCPKKIDARKGQKSTFFTKKGIFSDFLCKIPVFGHSKKNQFAGTD